MESYITPSCRNEGAIRYTDCIRFYTPSTGIDSMYSLRRLDYK